MVASGEHANVLDVPYLVEYHGLETQGTVLWKRKVLHPMVVRFEFVRSMPLRECITMHYSHPQVIIDFLCNIILQFLKEILRMILLEHVQGFASHMKGIALNCDRIFPMLA